jgi:hypothetical protein
MGSDVIRLHQSDQLTGGENEKDQRQRCQLRKVRLSVHSSVLHHVPDIPVHSAASDDLLQLL